MNDNWISTAEAATIISKHSHHPVSPKHVQALVNRGKIGTRSLDGGTELLKRSDVESSRVAIGTGNGHRRNRAGTSKKLLAEENMGKRSHQYGGKGS